MLDRFVPLERWSSTVLGHTHAYELLPSRVDSARVLRISDLDLV